MQKVQADVPSLLSGENCFDANDKLTATGTLMMPVFGIKPADDSPHAWATFTRDDFQQALLQITNAT